MVSIAAILFVTLFRLLPHAPNFTPMGAVALMAGRYLSPLRASLLSLAAMLVSDFVLSSVYGYSAFTPISLFVYASFMLQPFLSRALKEFKFGYFYSAVLGSFMFFIITNFGVWLEGWGYSRSFSGLMECYVAAVPFFRTMLMGDLFWTTTLFLSFAAYGLFVKSYNVKTSY